MMSKHFFIPLCVALLLCNCSEKGSPEAKKENVPDSSSMAKFEAAMVKRQLGLNLVKGETYKLVSKSNTSAIMSQDGHSINMGFDMNSEMTFKITDLQNDIYSMEMRYEKLLMKVYQTTGIIEFSSEKTGQTDAMSVALKSLVKKSFWIKMTKAGKVISAEGMADFMDKILAGLKNLTPAQKQQLKEKLIQSYGEKALVSNIELWTAIFPADPVCMGQKWKTQDTLHSLLAMKKETTYQLSDSQEGAWHILGNATLETADKDTYTELAGIALQFDVSGTMTSDITTSSKTGWVKGATVRQSMTGNAYVKEGPGIPANLALPISISYELIVSE
ncbi:MAG: hypothetical protein IT236_19070 [Bacteroidia bacterium]|nr:hypothetical protein [Bacteroidia bacterium]